MNKREIIPRLCVVIACELFAVATTIMLFMNRQYDRFPLAIATLLMILLPAALERLFCCRIRTPVFIFAVLYTIGPMLGQCHNLYYTVAWWDKLLHITGGVIFALFGFFLFQLLNREQQSAQLPAAVFALCFSITIAALWEFVEFGADTFLGMDMQDDTVVTAIHSYMLDEGIGVVGSIGNITEAAVNGMLLPVEGYIDIGLIDSMLDMLLETVGAVVTVVLCLLDKGKHPAFERCENLAGMGSHKQD